MPADERTPASGRLVGWRPETGPALDEVDGLLASCPLTVEGRLPWSSNLTFLVGLADACAGDGTPLMAVYKPHRGEQALWDFPDGLYRREAAAHGLSEALGWGLVPPTVVREDGPFGRGSLQLFVEADYEQHYFTLVDGGGREDELARFCAFDAVANNADRKAGHILVGSDGRLWGIDHGLCFHVHHKLRTVVWEFAGEDVPAGLLADLARLVDDGLPGRLTELLSGSEAEALVARARHLVGAGVFPEPVGDRPPYPWPLV